MSSNSANKRVAQATLQSPANLLRRKCSCGNHTIAGAECAACAKDRQTLQRATRDSRAEAEHSADVPSIVHEVLRSPGRPLDSAARNFFEPRFGSDVGGPAGPVSSHANGALSIGHPNDQAERQANTIAGRVAASTSISDESTPGFDFSRVRVHTDERAAASAESVNAVAYTVGHDVVFGAGKYKPNTSRGRQLIAHELAHVVQQQGTGVQAVQRFEPEDAVAEMIGKTFTLNKEVTNSGVTMPKGSSVVITSWSNTATTVTANFTVGKTAKPVTIGKQHLVPATDTKSGLVQYHAGAAGEAKKFTALEAKITAQEKKITDWKAEEGKYTTEKGKKEWQRQMDVHKTELRDLKYKLTGEGYTAAELPERLKTKIDNKMVSITPQKELLNRSLIEETMFNAFDASTVKWVTFYNTNIGVDKKWPALDANLVKSMLYQESHMGTHGEFLKLPPYTKGERMTRFNIGQAIDSSGPQQILMIKEISPAIATKHKLDDVTKDAAAAQTRRDVLVKKGAAVDAAEKKELDQINARSDNGNRWNDFFTSDPRWIAAVEAFFAETVKARNLDYDFWIRTAVRWLFEKRKGVSDWPAAIRAYNGSVDKAAPYKKDVIGRRDAAKAATGDFVPKQHY